MQRRPMASLDKSRLGASMVEFAIVLPIFLTAILGILEFGRAFMVSQVIISASRAAVRKAVIEGATEADVKAIISEEIAANAIKVSPSELTVTFLVEGTAAGLDSATRGDQVGVRVQIPFSAVAVSHPMFMGNTTLSGECIMRRE